MKSCIALVAAGLVATTAAAAGVNPEHKFLDFVPLHKRQNVSPEKYACHENCGTVILEGRKEGTEQCKDEEFLEMFDECMKCALEFDIWDDYGNGVTEAAEECNLEIDLVAAPAGSLGNPASSSVAPQSTPTGTDAEEEEEEEETNDDDSAASHKTYSAGMMLAAAVAAAGLM